MSALHRWQTPTRYYLAVVQQDLFGQWEVFRVWGALQSGQGGSLREPASSERDAQRLAVIARRRAQRGYSPTAAAAPSSGTCNDSFEI